MTAADPDLTTIVDDLTTMVAFDTISLTSNLGLVTHITDALEDHALQVVVQPCDDGTRANVMARFGPDGPDGVVLSAHTDVVPVAGQDWHSNPFEVVEDGSRLVGRGTTDMKGFIACVMAAVPRLAAADLQVPVWIALSYDEEIGALGARPLAEAMAALPHPPTRVVVGEPTSMGIVNAHKSVRGHVATFRGRGGHSSQPDGGANALRALMLLGTYIDSLATAERDHRDDRFDPPFTTFNMAMASAGTALNIIPDMAELVFEYRALPDRDGPELADRIEAHAREVLLPQLQATAPEATFELGVKGILPALRTDPESPAQALVATVLGGDVTSGTAPFGTDAARFQDVGISSVVCGPGDIGIAHRPNEWIERDQLAACATFLADLVTHLST